MNGSSRNAFRRWPSWLTGPIASLMPNSVTIARAMSVARSRSFCAPVETSPNDQRLGRAAAQQHGELVLEVRPATADSDPRAAAASCSRARRSRAATIEILCTGSRFGSTRRDDRVARLVERDDAPLARAHDALLLEAGDRCDRSPRRSRCRSTASLSRRAASSAASLTRFARSAPANPAVRAAMTRRSTFSASFTCLDVNAEDRLAALHVGLVDEHLPIEPARDAAAPGRAPPAGSSRP